MSARPNVSRAQRTSPLLVLRTDANGQIGTGHVMRALALAQEWRGQGGEVVFVGHINGGSLRERIESEGFPLQSLPASHPDSQDLQVFLPWLRERRSQAGWVVLDGYHFDPAYHQELRATGWPLLIVDDYGHLPSYHADLLLNPNSYAKEIHYPLAADTLLLGGARYALLRQEFREACASRGAEDGGGPRHFGSRILLTMGGADPDNVAGKVVVALQAMEWADLELKVVVGPLNRHRQTLTELLRQLSIRAEIMTAVTDMVPLMLWADLAISAAGTTCWELASLGVPMVVTVLAENQVRLAASLAAQGVAVNLGWHHEWQVGPAGKVCRDLLAQSRIRREMGQRGQRLVDGRGASRLIQAMRGCHFSWRLATEADCELLFQWANDPLTRAASFSQIAITWEEHCRWLAGRLTDPEHRYYLACLSSGTPIAQVRFAWQGLAEAVISVSLAPEFRGVGLGGRIISRACQQALAERPGATIRALIRPDNAVSVHAFVQAGFCPRGEVEAAGQPALAMDYSLLGGRR